MMAKVVAITGTTSGTGYICAREIARKGGTVLLLNRKSDRSEAAIKKLREEAPSAKFYDIVCDLQNLARIRKAIEEIKAKYESLDVLCNNAG